MGRLGNARQVKAISGYWCSYSPPWIGRDCRTSAIRAPCRAEGLGEKPATGPLIGVGVHSGQQVFLPGK